MNEITQAELHAIKGLRYVGGLENLSEEHAALAEKHLDFGKDYPVDSVEDDFISFLRYGEPCVNVDVGVGIWGVLKSHIEKGYFEIVG